MLLLFFLFVVECGGVLVRVGWVRVGIPWVVGCDGGFPVEGVVAEGVWQLVWWAG